MIALKTNVMGVEFDNVTMEEALDAAESMLRRGEKGFCVTPNAEILHCALQDPAYQALLNRACLVLPDGAGAVLGSKILGRPLKGKVAGIDFADNLCGRLARSGRTLYLLGSQPGVAEAAAVNLQKKHPGLQICGTHHGYFTEVAPVLEEINRVKPDVLFVCLGAPKQERFMDQYMNRLDTHFLIGLGGSLDVFSGTLRRAPKWIQNCGMEWLYRIFQNPKRLRRSVSRPKFVLACLKERSHQRKNG